MAFHVFNKVGVAVSLYTNMRESLFKPLTTDALQLSFILDLH